MLCQRMTEAYHFQWNLVCYLLFLVHSFKCYVSVVASTFLFALMSSTITMPIGG